LFNDDIKNFTQQVTAVKTQLYDATNKYNQLVEKYQELQKSKSELSKTAKVELARARLLDPIYR